MTKKEIKKAAEDYTDKFGFICDVGDVFTAFEDGAKWALSNMWHSVADGDLPKEDVFENNMLIVYGAGIGFEYDAQYVKENGGAFGFYTPAIGFNEIDDFNIIEGVEYWMEIPEVKEKER